MNKLPNTDGKNLEKLLESEGIEKYKAAEKLQKEVDYALCSAGLIQAMKIGDNTYKQSIEPQKNIIYETNLLTAKGLAVFVDKSTSKDNSATSRSKYLWSQKSAETFYRLQTVPIQTDTSIGSDFEFMMKLHHMLAVNLDIGMVDTIYMIPSLDDPVGSTTARAASWSSSGAPNYMTKPKTRLETEAFAVSATAMQTDMMKTSTTATTATTTTPIAAGATATTDQAKDDGISPNSNPNPNSTFAGIVRAMTTATSTSTSTGATTTTTNSANDHFIRLFSHFKFSINSYSLSKVSTAAVKSIM